MAQELPYDVTVIGSGLGGLTAAACLAQAGRRVCLIERNRSLGGSASTYKIGELTIEAALHETADPHDPFDPKHHVLKKLGVLDEIDWLPVGPLYEVRGGPLGDEPFVLGHGFDTVRRDMQSRFPDVAAGTTRILDSMEGVVEALGALTVAREDHSLFTLARGLAGMGGLVSGWHKSLGDVLASDLGTNEAAKCALAANLPYYADDPARFWWLAFCVAQGGLIRSGGTFIKGGSSRLSIKLARIVKKAGGQVILGRAACGVDMDESGRVNGVRHAAPDGGGEDRVATRVVLANCAPETIAAMLPADSAGRFAGPYAGLDYSTSLFSIHFGIRKSAAVRLPGAYSTMLLPDWMTHLSDFARAGEMLAADPGGRLPPVAMVNYGAIDSGLADDAMGLLTITGIDRLANWHGLSKDQERARRRAWTDSFTARLDDLYPGFAGAVGATNFLSALSMHNYLGAPQGAVYGFAPTPPQGPIWKGIGRSPATAIPGLFLASAFAGAGGFSGAIGSGAQAAEMAARFLGALDAG